MSYLKIENSKPIRICFLGCGTITKAHAKFAKKADANVELSFASRSLEKAESYKLKYNGVHAFSNYEEAIVSDEIDVIMINTPPNSHFELSKLVMEAGKHLIVEKPPFFKSQDFDVIGEMAEDRHLQFIVAENYYYKPLRKTITNILENGLIGDPLFMVINATKTQLSKGDWRDDKSITGFGSLFEGGIHWVNFINNIGLHITRVYGFQPKQKTTLERSMQVTAQSKEGVVVNLLYSWEVNTIAKGLRISKIYGREGSVTFETNGIFVWLRGKKKRLMFPGLRHIAGYQKMFNDFAKAFRSGDAPEFNWQMAKQDLELIEQVYSTV